MNTLKPVLNSGLLIGVLAAMSVTTALDASAVGVRCYRGHHCVYPSGHVVRHTKPLSAGIGQVAGGVGKGAAGAVAQVQQQPMKTCQLPTAGFGSVQVPCPAR